MSLSGSDLRQKWREQRGTWQDTQFPGRLLLRFRFQCDRAVRYENPTQIRIRTEGLQARGIRNMRDRG